MKSRYGSILRILPVEGIDRFEGSRTQGVIHLSLFVGNLESVVEHISHKQEFLLERIIFHVSWDQLQGGIQDIERIVFSDQVSGKAGVPQFGDYYVLELKPVCGWNPLY